MLHLLLQAWRLEEQHCAAAAIPCIIACSTTTRLAYLPIPDPYPHNLNPYTRILPTSCYLQARRLEDERRAADEAELAQRAASSSPKTQ
jgi:hypothetical protein